MKVNLKTRHRILVADDDTPFARRLCDYLRDHGFEVRVSARISECKEIVEFWNPDTVFIDLLLPETNALSLFRFIQTRNLRTKPRLVVMSRQSTLEGIEQMRKAGAAHYLVKPFSLEDAFRAVNMGGDEIMPPVSVPPVVALQTPVKSEAMKELHLLNLFLKQAMTPVDGEPNLHNLMRMMNIKVKAIRTSLVQCLNHETGIVLASNDDESVQGLPLNLLQYPEIQEVRRHLRTVIIPNVRTCDIMALVQEHLNLTPYETILLFPVFQFGTFFGVMSVRMEQKDPLELFYAEKFGNVCAQIISLAIATQGQMASQQSA